MIIPSIGLQGGHAVQLIGGDAKVPDAGDLRPLAWRFALISGITVVDLDAGPRRQRDPRNRMLSRP
jgi:phosphoribosylformimino-5-aminoimidazole carboxamide ribonucleotide (ProFAR) isomerase